MTIIRGTEVAKQMAERLQVAVTELEQRGITPCAAIVRVGENPGDLSYERGAVKKLEALGIQARRYPFPRDIPQERFLEELNRMNQDAEIHGILMLRPLPAQLDEREICGAISQGKDIDAVNPVNLYKVLAGDKSGFAPCTPEAVLEILDFAGVELAGRRVTVVGRSLVVGKPLALLAQGRNATVTVCHSGTKDLPIRCREAEILLVAIGRRGMVTADYVAPGAVVVDVGINVNEEGKLCGDVDFEGVSERASVMTPVPGGVGAVTTSVLAGHVVKAARIQNGL